jgi:carbonic anhydrase
VTRLLLALACSLALLAGCGDEERASVSEPPEWSYTENGGPEKWASLSDEYDACDTGREQSPIDLKGAEKSDLPPLELDYRAGPALVENNGHTVEVVPEHGGWLTLDGIRYKLLQFHFHSPSEHTVRGRERPLELHFVHSDRDENLLVLGLLVKPGDPSGAWDAIAGALPAEEGGEAELEHVDVGELLPERAGTATRWSYPGSLTTPGCSEGVKWQVFEAPLELSPQQILEFQAAYDHNRRPVQPRGGRELLRG